MKLSLPEKSVEKFLDQLRQTGSVALTETSRTSDTQPVHTVYGGAHLFRFDTMQKLGQLSLQSLRDTAPDFASFARAFELEKAASLPTEAVAIENLTRQLKLDVEAVRQKNYAAWFAWTIYSRVTDKLAREPVEDYRLDFEDGYGCRADAEEDQHALTAATETARGLVEGTLPRIIGIRLKPLTAELGRRSVRTLDLFLSQLLHLTGGRLPGCFLITLPKVILPEQVSALAGILHLLELQTGLAPGTLKIEIMIESPRSIISERGEIRLPALLSAAQGRCVAANFGAYDYSAECNIVAACQHLLHPACNFARQMMQASLARTGIWLSDGATGILPVGPHRARGLQPLSPEQLLENRQVVRRAWKIHFDHIRTSLQNGFYQSLDLHPAQLPARYAAVHSFFLEHLDNAAARLNNFVSQAAQATRVGVFFDDAATGQGLLNFFLRAVRHGAVTEAEAARLTGLTLAELQSASFIQILNHRQRSG